MDELEISGKRYISTRRAAKDHKYSPDYIGQLIRGKKVTGQKVGRSWYVEEKSLANYFKGEKSLGTHIAEADVVEVIEAKQQIPDVIEAEVIETKTVEVRKIKPVLAHITIGNADIEKEIESVPAAIPQKNISHTRYIPINMKKKKGLTYISDDAPVFPVVERRKRVPAAKKNLVAQDEVIISEETLEVREEEIIPMPSRKNSSFVKLLVLAVVGIFIFSAVAMISASIGTVTKVEAGKATNTQFTFQ